MASSAEEEEVVKEVAATVEDNPEFREAVARSHNIDDDLAVVFSGTQLWKVRSFSKWYRRKYFVDRDAGALKYEHSHKHSCFGDPRYIQVGDILDVRRGWKTDTFNKFGIKVVGEQRKMKRSSLSLRRRPPGQDGDKDGDDAKPLVDEACCFSVVYGESRGSLDLVADSPQVAAVWVRALRHVLTVIRGLNQDKRFILWLRNQFQEADVDKSGTLEFDEVLRLLLQLNIKMSKNEALRIFNLADTNKQNNRKGEPILDTEEFLQFYQLLMARPDLDALYHKYARSAHEMTASELQNFLRKEQGMAEVTLEDCRSLIDAFEQSEELRKSGRISIPSFHHILRSEQFQIAQVAHKTVYQDMTQPLSSYYIASSHNTYLLGRQVVAESTIEGYVEALRRGCRCIELDCWDGPDGEPVVTHGYALTSKLVFREVLKDAILPNAFTYSEYPLILSLENHCTSEQQQRLAFHFTDVFGDLLYVEPVSPDMETLPSPEQLKRRILIKGRKAAPVQAAESESDEDDEMDLLSPHHANGHNKSPDSSDESEASVSPATSRPSSPNLSAAENHKTPAHKTRSRRKSQQPKPPQLEKVTDQSLSDLVNVCEGVHFHGFKDGGKCYQMVSLSESKATKLMDKCGEELIEFNTRRLSRIYPAGTRTGSTNYQPWPLWNAGCQLVALNYQANGEPVFINEARFRDNGGCGYVLKPDFLRLPDYAKFGFNPVATSIKQIPILKERRRLLTIQVISGQHLPKPEGEGLSDIVDPYVQVKILGHPMDVQKKRTHVIRDNGLNPRWGTAFQFVINVPDLAFIFLIVKDETPRRVDPVVGSWALPFTSLAPGYRHVPLMDMKRHLLRPASLFIHSKITELVS